MPIDYEKLYTDSIVDLSGQLKNSTRTERARAYDTLKEREDILFLDLSNNEMRGELVDPTAKASFNFRSAFSYRRQAASYDPPKFKSILAEEAKHIASIIRKNTHLRGINLAGSDIREDSMKIILNAISNEHKKLTSINIENNNLFHPDNVLEDFLKQNQTVEYFWYGDTAVGGKTIMGTTNYTVYDKEKDQRELKLEDQFQAWVKETNQNLKNKDDYLTIIFEDFAGPNRSYSFDRNKIHGAIDQSPIEQMQVFDPSVGMDSHISRKIKNQSRPPHELKKIFDRHEEEIKNDIAENIQSLTPGSKRLAL